MFFLPLFSSNLTTKKIGHKIEYFRVLDSTNKIIYAMFENNEIKSGALVIADEQTEGKGRRSNKWISEPGKSLTFSLIIKNNEPQLIKKLPLVLGIAIIEAIKKLTKVNCYLKWPNDILYQSKKLAGILIEQKKNHFIIGVGINVNDANLDTSIKNGVSLQSILQHSIQREPLLAFICNNIETLLESDMATIIHHWESVCSHMNSIVKFHNHNKIIVGKFVGLNQNGEASLELNKKIQFFHSGVIES